MYVCMYVCICLCVYYARKTSVGSLTKNVFYMLHRSSTYVYTYVHTCMYTYINTYCVASQQYVRMYVCIHTYIHTSTLHPLPCSRWFTLLLVYRSTYTHNIHVCMYVLIRAQRVYMHVCIPTYIHVYIHT